MSVTLPEYEVKLVTNTEVSNLPIAFDIRSYTHIFQLFMKKDLVKFGDLYVVTKNWFDSISFNDTIDKIGVSEMMV